MFSRMIKLNLLLKSSLFLILQVCSVFYLATNTNGTIIRGLFYYLFRVIYTSLFFAVCFVETFERLAKTYQFLKIFMAVVQDHLDIDIDTLLILYSVICCIALHALQT